MTKKDKVINDLLHIQMIYLILFREILELGELIMRFRQRVVPRRRWGKAPVPWVRQWLRRREDRVQYHNQIAELY